MPAPIPDTFDRTVCLQVRVIDGKITMLDGSALPQIQTNISAELSFLAVHILQDEERIKFTEEYEVPFLVSGAVLWVKVKPNEHLEKSLAAHRIKKRPHCEDDGLFLPILLQQDLNLQIRAGKHSKLGETKIHIPNLNIDAKSINEAYTKVSTVYEPSRRSHSGNVFQEVYYEHDDTLHRLHRLRLAREITPRPPRPPQSPAASRTQMEISLLDAVPPTDPA